MKTLQKAGKSRVRQGGSLGNSKIFQRTKWIDNIEYPDSEPDTGYDTKPYIGYNPSGGVTKPDNRYKPYIEYNKLNDETKPYTGYKNSCFSINGKVKDNKTEKLKKEYETEEDETEEETESEEEKEREDLPKPTTQEEAQIYETMGLLIIDNNGTYRDDSDYPVLTEAEFLKLPANAKDKIKKLKEEKMKKLKKQIDSLPRPTTKEEVINYVKKKLLRMDQWGNFHDKCGRVPLTKAQFLILPEDEEDKYKKEFKEEKRQRRREKAQSKAKATTQAEAQTIKKPKSQNETRLWEMIGFLTRDAFGNYNDKFGRQVLSRADFYTLPPDEVITKLNFDVARDSRFN